MRYQQKLQREQDQKRSDLLSPTASVTSGGGSGSGGAYRMMSQEQVALGNGKVRQLFEERRQQQRGIGIDKSYPLQPIQGTTQTTITTTTTTTNTKRPGVSGGTPRTVLFRGAAPLKSSNGSSPVSVSRTKTTKFALASDRNNNLDDPPHVASKNVAGRLAALSLSNEINNNHNNYHTNGGSNSTIKLKPVTSSSRTTNGGGLVVGGSTRKALSTLSPTQATSMSNNGHGNSVGRMEVSSTATTPTKSVIRGSADSSQSSQRSSASTKSPVRVS